MTATKKTIKKTTKKEPKKDPIVESAPEPVAQPDPPVVAPTDPLVPTPPAQVEQVVAEAVGTEPSHQTPVAAVSPAVSPAPVVRTLVTDAPSLPQASQPVITLPTPEVAAAVTAAPVAEETAIPSPEPTPLASEITPTPTDEPIVSAAPVEEKVQHSVPVADLQAPLPKDSTVAEMTDEVMVKAKREWSRGIVGLALFLVLAGGVGYGYYRLQVAPDKTAVTASAAPSATIAATPSPAATALTQPTFAVWNGSGKAGAAGAMAAKLKALGYEVVETGNAPEEQTGTTLELDAALADQEEAIMELVGVTTSLPLTGEDLSYTARVVIGK